MTNFTSSVGARRSKLSQSIRAASPLPGHFTSITVTTPVGTSAIDAMAASFDEHGLAAIEQRLHQRIDVLLQQRLAAGDLDHVAAVALDLVEDRPRATIFWPSWNAYGVSHHEQRRSQAVRRTKTHGRPA